jgi:hydroxymethylbilane synthase
VRKIVHWQTEYRVSAERACLRKLEGGCSVPVGVCSDLVESADGGPKLSLTGTVTSLDGKEFVVFTVESRVVNSVEEAEQVGLEVAEALIANGAARILKEIEISKRESGAVGSGLLEK